jgi:hypothetical protein
VKSKYKPDIKPPVVNRYDDEAIQSVIDGVVATTTRYEDKWGVGRLELLVDDELRLRFRDQYKRFNDAVMAHDVVLVRTRGAAMNRAWDVLDRTAEAAGAQPLDPEIWEIELPDGRVIAFCRHLHDSFHVARSGRQIEIWTPEEIVRVITAFPEIAKAKDVFPGATVVSVKPKPLSDFREPDEHYQDQLEDADV